MLIGLSCTKDVQDAILDDPARGPAVSVIDLKYWWYTADGSLVRPRGGREPRAPAATPRVAGEARPVGRADGPAGPRVPRALPRQGDPRRRRPGRRLGRRWPRAARCRTCPRADPRAARGLAADAAFRAGRADHGNRHSPSPGRNYLVYAESRRAIRLEPVGRPRDIHGARIDPRTGRAVASGEVMNTGAKSSTSRTRNPACCG